MKSQSVSLQMKGVEQYFSLVLTLESVDEILKCHTSNVCSWAVLSCGAVYFALQVGSNVLSRWMKS